ncbi:hypothetical protein V6N13_145872 [Hibiscus sabdariffa]|uniref:Uncharacterized protein n=1 Tax=Hibiscus sabdariffa TaxID=183260 RepID=A0ABR2TQY6_9ROSI
MALLKPAFLHHLKILANPHRRLPPSFVTLRCLSFSTPGEASVASASNLRSPLPNALRSSRWPQQGQSKIQNRSLRQPPQPPRQDLLGSVLCACLCN